MHARGGGGAHTASCALSPLTPLPHAGRFPSLGRLSGHGIGDAGAGALAGALQHLKFFQALE